MRPIVSTATTLLPHPPDRVWAAVTDLDRWQWRSDLRRLDRIGEDTFTEYDKTGFPTRFTVTDRRPPTLWAFDVDNANPAGGPGSSGRRTAAPGSPSPRPSL